MESEKSLISSVAKFILIVMTCFLKEFDYN